MNSVKLERLKEMIREEVAELILHGLNDPRLGFCTVTHVDLAKDYTTCVVHVSVLGDEAQKRTSMRALEGARGLIQGRIANRMRTRVTPVVHIRLDETIERSYRILTKIKEARASDPDHGVSTTPPPGDKPPEKDEGDEEDPDDEDEEKDAETEDDEPDEEEEGDEEDTDAEAGEEDEEDEDGAEAEDDEKE